MAIVSFELTDCHVSSEFQCKHIKTGKVVNMKKIQLFLWTGVLFLILTSCGIPRATPTQGANSVVISTFTAAPANSATPSTVLTPTLVSTPNLEVVGQLPGLSPVN